MGKMHGSSAYDARKGISWAAGAATTTLQQSGSVDLEGYPMVGLLFGTSWPTGGAGTLSVVVGTGTGGTFVNLHDDGGTEVSFTVARNRAVALTGAEADAVAPWRIMKFRRGTATNLSTATTPSTMKLVLKS